MDGKYYGFKTEGQITTQALSTMGMNQ